jgi:predicted lipid-binding transport protein (Tim44 family)
MKLTKCLLILLSCSLIFSQSAFAARIGGGKSYGMQRNTSNYSSQNRSYQQPSQQAQPNQRPGMGAGTAALLGAAAGAAGGYMLGKSSNSGNASGTQTGMRSESNIPWGMIGILAVLLFLGLMLFRKSKANPGFFGNSGNINSSNGGFNIPTLNRTNMAANTAQAQFSNQSSSMPNNMTDKMPDGIEPIYFLRQVKGMFLHIQSMNNPDNITEIEKYMTAGLYQEIRSSVSENTFVADFANLDCQLLGSEMVNAQLVASVKFFGMVSDEPNQPSHPFSEIWNFVKTDLTTSGKWLVAGIQQETLS